MLVTASELFRSPIKERYAIGGFDTTCYALTEAILRAAEENETPLFLMVPPFAYGQAYDTAFIRHAVTRCREIKTPVALHLDHAASFDAVHEAIEAGFSSVMIDASSLSFEENVALTRQVVDFAHARGVSVEAEIGHVGGGEAQLEPGLADESGYTEPEAAVAFVQATGVDLLAVAFGTVHGSFLGAPRLDLDRLRDIHRLLPHIPLVMHGGSGLNDDDFRAAVDAGISKVNIFTEISTLYTAEMVKIFHASEGRMHLHSALRPAENAVVDTIKHLTGIFGTPKSSRFAELQAFS